LFQNAAGERITGKLIKLRLSCQNPLVTPSPLDVTDLDMDGEITVREPKDCDGFQATVIGPAEFKQKNYILSRDTQPILLEALDVAKGGLRARIKDQTGNIIVSTNFVVKALDQDGYKVGERYSSSYGEASFENLTIGTYSVSVEDSSGNYYDSLGQLEFTAVPANPAPKVLTRRDAPKDQTEKICPRQQYLRSPTGFVRWVASWRHYS